MPNLPQCPPPLILACNDNNNNAVLNKPLQNVAALISKEDQSSWLKIKCVRGRNAI